ncbi:MAG: Uma2 family endonuclease [Verrucomicrobia bacterium]|nr:Uma2 family endonuclease [Verrucomicrobiota bacterium]
MATTETIPVKAARLSVKRRWTYDELLAEMPETNQPSELWDGELIMSPAPHPKHQEIVARIWQAIDQFVSARQLGKVFLAPLDVVLSPRRTVQPDVIYISKGNQDVIQDGIRGVPDLVVEVLSEGSWRRDRIDKKALYEQSGVSEYWIVDLETRTIEVFALVAAAYQLHAKATDAQSAKSKLLKGFSLSFDQVASR